MTETVSSDERRDALSQAVDSRLEQGYTVESRDDTQAVLLMKGRKRFMRASSESRQLVTVDETGKARFQKMDEVEA